MPRTFHWKWVGLLAVTLTPGLALAQEAAPQTHTVREGDTLWDIARRYLGDPFLWPDIYRINTSVVEDPHWIYPGEVLRLAPGNSDHAVPHTDTPEPPDGVVAASDTIPADSAAQARRSWPSPAGGGEVAPAGQRPRSPSSPPCRPTSRAKAGLFGPEQAKMLEESLRAYTNQPYRPLRRSEFYSSGFLTQNEKLPFGGSSGR